MKARTTVYALALLGCLPALASLAPREAAATKEYARTEKKDCSHCHVSDKGAGPRNAVGRMYEANGYKFGVKSWSSDVNRNKYLRSNAAYTATWYGETRRLLSELAAEETLPGGLALVAGKKKKLGLFPRAWLRAAKSLLKKGSRGAPNAVNRFLVKLESQFADLEQGKEAAKLLDDLAGKPETRKLVEEGRAREKVRLRYLTARTELGLGNDEVGRGLLEAVVVDPLAAPFLKDARKLLTELDGGGK